MKLVCVLRGQTHTSGVLASDFQDGDGLKNHVLCLWKILSNQ